jgi:hypothetical protein
MAARARRARGDITGIADAGRTRIAGAAAALFAGFASTFALVTDAVFETDPSVEGSNVSEIVADDPLAIVPSAQVTVNEPLHVP